MLKPLPSFLRFPLSAALLIATLPLSGCILAAAGLGAGAGYATLAQERSPADQLKDTEIRSLVSQSWNDYSFDLAHDLDATVYEGRVLITGTVPTEEMRQEAVKRTWKINGVKQVYDEIEVGPGTHFVDEARDSVISTRLKNDLVWDSQVKSINYTIKTENGVVYLMGSARSQGERDRVLGYARNIPNVRRVVDYVTIRSGAPASPDPVASSTPAAAPPPAVVSPAAQNAPAALAPSGQIETTPLR